MKIGIVGARKYQDKQSVVDLVNSIPADEKVITSGCKGVCTWVKEAAIKKAEDYRVLAYIFGNLRLRPDYEKFTTWINSVGKDGIAVGQGLGLACSSPMHFIQKTFISATDFYYHYHDYHKEMRKLAEALENAYNQLLTILAGSPAARFAAPFGLGAASF